MLLYFVLSVEFCAAVALLLLPLEWEGVWKAMDRMWWSVTLQTLGALISGGLLWAFARAARFREEKWPRILDQVRKLSYALRGGGPVITGTGSATLQPLSAALGGKVRHLSFVTETQRQRNGSRRWRTSSTG